MNWVIFYYFFLGSGVVLGECKLYNVLNELGRYWSSIGYFMICDNNFVSDYDGWYCFEGVVGIMMVIYCILI